MSKEITLLSLILRFFKGAKDFTFNPQGLDASVYGDNEVGKTTLFDALMWLLFDKDSNDKKKFSIKTLDKGKVISGVDHEVEGVLLIGSKKLLLKKVYSEEWVKKRGAITAEFSGHVTAYYIDGVPSTKKEYEEKISGIVNEDVFKLLTNPAYFNEKLEWKEKRKILLQVCGDVADSEVIASKKGLEILTDVLGDHSIDDYRKIIHEKRKKINGDLEKLPIRIDEANKSKPSIDGLNEAELVGKIALAKELVTTKESELSRILNGGEVAVKEKRAREIEGELQTLKNGIEANSLDKVTAKRREISDLRNQSDDVRSLIRGNEQRKATNDQTIRRNADTRNQLLKEWESADGQIFESKLKDSCPACLQSLPAEQFNASFQKATEQFNINKSNLLQGINERGQRIKAETEQLTNDSAALDKEFESLDANLKSFRTKIDDAESELSLLQEDVKTASTDLEYLRKKSELTTVEQEIQKLKSSVNDSAQTVRDAIPPLKLDVEKLEQDKAKFAQVIVLDERINDLKGQEKALATEYEKLEQELYLTEEFIRTKVSMLESKINSKFKYVSFKLFDQQVNGGLQEVCETLYGDNLVPYSSGLNRAAQTNAGLDIINTLSDHHSIVAPIFIDNAEGVTKPIETKGQQIRLVVSENDRILRIETYKKQEAI